MAAVSAVMLLYRSVDLFAEYLQHRAEKTDTKLDDQLVPMVRRGLKVLIIAIGAAYFVGWKILFLVGIASVLWIASYLGGDVASEEGTRSRLMRALFACSAAALLATLTV